MELTGQEKLFVELFAGNEDHYLSALTAGYSHNVAVTAFKWIATERKNSQRRDMFDYWTTVKENAGINLNMSVEDIKRELIMMVRFDPGDLYHPDGRLKELGELEPYQRKMIVGVDYKMQGMRKVYKLADKVQVLKMLGEHIGVQAFTKNNNVNTNANVTIENPAEHAARVAQELLNDA